MIMMRMSGPRCFCAVLFLAVSLMFQAVFVSCDMFIVEVPPFNEREVGYDVDIAH